MSSSQMDGEVGSLESPGPCRVVVDGTKTGVSRLSPAAQSSSLFEAGNEVMRHCALSSLRSAKSQEPAAEAIFAANTCSAPCGTATRSLMPGPHHGLLVKIPVSPSLLPQCYRVRRPSAVAPLRFTEEAAPLVGLLVAARGHCQTWATDSARHPTFPVSSKACSSLQGQGQGEDVRRWIRQRRRESVPEVWTRRVWAVWRCDERSPSV